MGAESQTIPARHGTATFVPAGSTIKIINTSGNQAVATWAFALPNPPSQDEANAPPTVKGETPKKTKKGWNGFPSQEEAENATSQGMQADNDPEPASKSGWSSYIPSVNLLGSKSDGEKKEVEQNSKGWSQYLSAGQGFTSYIPTKESLSVFATSHYRDPNKPYIQQLSDFSKTPVGAAGVSALSGGGYASTFYAGYSAWTGAGGDSSPPMEYLSVSHTRLSTGHLNPSKGDILVSNLREPMLTLIEDTPGVHDTFIPASDPQRFHQLGLDDWMDYGSCAENLVLALKELNQRAGLQGPKGIGAAVTVHSAPQPLNLFMNVTFRPSGDIAIDKPTSKRGDHVRLRAERDVVVVMSAGPHESLDSDQDAHFIVEEELEPSSEDIRARLEAAEKKPLRKTGVRKLERTAPKKAKPAPSAGHAPLWTKKTPKTNGGSIFMKRGRGTDGLAALTATKPKPQLVRHDSASSVPTNPKTSEAVSTADKTPSQAVQERKKPRKIGRKTA